MRKVEETKRNFVVRDAPTASKVSHRTFHILNVEFGWVEHLGDIPTVFLQGVEVADTRTILMRAPKEFTEVKPGHCLMFLTPVYGKGNAPMVWYFSFRR